MGQPSAKNVLFLCTGNYYRSRFAEILFNSIAAKMRLPWRVTSRGLAIERGVNNVGSMARAAIEALEELGIRAADAVARLPAQATADDLGQADRIVALKQAEHLPLLQERFPDWAENAEFWHVDDAPEALVLIEREVMDLIARLIGGGPRLEPATQPETLHQVERQLLGAIARLMESAPRLAATTRDAAREEVGPRAGKKGAKRPAVVRVGRETKGRRGKGVTTVSDVPLDEKGLLELAAQLKQRCGTGGTVKDGRIEIQGDQRDRLIAVLEDMDYRVKRVGG